MSHRLSNARQHRPASVREEHLPPGVRPARCSGRWGAFMALPVAALIYSFVHNYCHSHKVVYRTAYAEDDQPQSARATRRPRAAAGQVPVSSGATAHCHRGRGRHARLADRTNRRRSRLGRRGRCRATGSRLGGAQGTRHHRLNPRLHLAGPQTRKVRCAARPGLPGPIRWRPQGSQNYPREISARSTGPLLPAQSVPGCRRPPERRIGLSGPRYRAVTN